MENKTPNIICGVCGGKGGWPTSVNESKWSDCGYCDGFGFHPKLEEDESHSFLLKYNSYRKQITELLSETVSRVDAFATPDYGNTIELKLSPYNRAVWEEFLKFVLKLGHFSSNIKIHIVQDFYYKPEVNRISFHWKMILKPNILNDLDGFVDLLKIWDRSGGNGRLF